MIFNKMQFTFSLYKINCYWSTPKIIGALMLVGMLLIFSFENLGLSQREQNLGLRNSNPEIIIKSIVNSELLLKSSGIPHQILKTLEFKEFAQNSIQLNQKIETIKYEQNSNLLIDGAMDQLRSHHFDEGSLDFNPNESENGNYEDDNFQD